MESIFKNLEENKTIRNIQHRFIERKSGLANLISFYDSDRLCGSVALMGGWKEGERRYMRGAPALDTL